MVKDTKIDSIYAFSEVTKETLLMDFEIARKKQIDELAEAMKKGNFTVYNDFCVNRGKNETIKKNY